MNNNKANNDQLDYNESRAKALIETLQFRFSPEQQQQVRQLLIDEINHYHSGSSEYLRFLCGYLYCIGDLADLALIKTAKQINMDVGTMIDSEWLDSLENGGIEDDFTQSRDDLVQQFIDYYRGYFG